MNRDELLARVGTLRTFERDLEVAPHKPLLLLWALGRFAAGAPRHCHLADVDEALGPLLAELSPRTKGKGAEFPFWALQSDGLWVVTPPGLEPRKGHTSRPSRKSLLAPSVRGALTDEVVALLSQEPDLAEQVINRVLALYFPVSLHARIRTELRLPAEGPESGTRSPSP